MPELFILLLVLGANINSTGAVNGAQTWAMRHIQASVPTSSNSHCPGENQTCNTLNELIKRDNQYGNVFSSYQYVMFLSGNHIINTSNPSLYVMRVQYLILQGEPDHKGEVTITCLNEFNFLFADVRNVTIKSLKFVNCKAFPQFTVREQLSSTFIVWGAYSENILFNNVEIVSENATGIILMDSWNIRILNSNFTTGGIGIYSERSRVNIFRCLFKGSSLKYYESPHDSMIVEYSIFEQTKMSPVVYCDSSKSLELKSVSMISNPAQFLIVITDCNVLLKEQNLFYNNSGAIMVDIHGTLDIKMANVSFINNVVESALALPGAPLCVAGGRVIFENSFVTFLNNSGEDCGGIVAHHCIIELMNTTINFIGNRGAEGGAMAMYRQAELRFFRPDNKITIINFIENVADKQGGGLFVDDKGYMTDFYRNLSRSFIGYPDVSAKFHFFNNTARFSGNQIHGGWIDWWANADNHVHLSFNKNTTDIFHFEPAGPLDVSSDPVRVCMCTNSIANCSITEHVTEIIPGQTVSFEIVAVGQRYGTTVSSIIASTDESGESVASPDVIPQAEYFQIVQRTCTPVHYTIIMSAKNEERLHLRPFQRNRLNVERNLLEQHPFHKNLFKEFSIKVTLKKCPLGFVFSHIVYSCVCLKSLELRGLSCNTKLFQVVRTEQKWVTAVFNHTMPDEYPGVIIHDQCPYDYCRKDTDSLSIRLEFYEEQCANSRSGTLCGKCRPNLSQILGSSHCRECSNLMLLVIIPITVVLGPLLVAFLMILNLTVSVGTINGLIFYANVIRAQHTMFFVPEISNSFLNKFIAWLNLDLGIEACFYDGLDALTKTWLQFLFPIYIWLLVIAIIVSSHYSTRISRISGNNAVQVLATLFLLSYTKLLRVIITVFSSTVIVYPDKFTKWVWLYDGNVEFLRGKHLVLFILTLIFLSLSVPYTLSLVTIQWLLRVSHYRVLFWVQKFKPLFDAYTGPYKTRHRYWTGLLLVVRLVVLIAFSLNRANNPAINLFIISIISFTLILLLYATRWVYKSIINNCLEITFVLNLGILSTSILFDMANNKRSLIMVQLSSGLAFTLFVLITLYHAQEQFLHSRIGRKFKGYVISKYLSIRRQAEEGAADHEDAATNVHHSKGGGVSQTVVELKECLLTDES